jgi:hypothetical protein
MTSNARAAAGDNERLFEALFEERAPQTSLLGKRRYVRGNVEISVDQSFTHAGTTYLVEVDSGNMAKLLVGQYLLLNCLLSPSDRPAFFVVVHTYKKFNPTRTIANLSLVNQELLQGKGIPFGAIHISSLIDDWFNGTHGLLERLAAG